MRAQTVQQKLQGYCQSLKQRLVARDEFSAAEIGANRRRAASRGANNAIFKNESAAVAAPSWKQANVKQRIVAAASRSNHHDFFVFAEDLPQGVADFAHRGVGLDGRDDGRHQVGAVTRRFVDLPQGRVGVGLHAFGAESA